MTGEEEEEEDGIGLALEMTGGKCYAFKNLLPSVYQVEYSEDGFVADFQKIFRTFLQKLSHLLTCFSLLPKS
jgi:hypothetical protein